MPDADQIDAHLDMTSKPTLQAPRVALARDANEPDGAGRTLRGPLRYEVETSSPSLEAGKFFSIFLRITNPYDVPVVIRDAVLKCPVEFKYEHANGDGHRLLMPWRGTRAKPMQVEHAAAGFAPSGSPLDLEGSSVDFSVGLIRTERTPPARVTPSPELPADARETIQPGNTVICEASVRTHRAVLFSPAVYNAEAAISYEMDRQLNHDAVKLPLSIKAPLWSLVVGAIVGAIGGSLFQLLHADKGGVDEVVMWDPQFHVVPAAALKFGVGLLSSALLSAIVIVAFARKKDAQPFVSVEDFYGSLFIGFMVGINGASWISFIGNGAAPTGQVTP